MGCEVYARRMGNIGVYSTATEMLAALDRGEVTSVDLVEMQLERIDAVDGDINAIAVNTPDRARAAAQEADRRRADGDSAPLLGLPLTLKESTRTAGLPQSAGIPEFAGFVPETDGRVAERVSAAGGCLLGTTNIPFALSDWQADSAVYGRTLNPWDTTRSPGGSTGGGGAALAAGMTPLEIGSDIGGSIRVPAHYSGVTGHKSSYGVVPALGQIPGAPGTLSQADLAVAGPMARDVDDLVLGLEVMAGPDRWSSPAWRLDLPPARAEQLADFRVAAWLDDAACPVDADTARVLGGMCATIESAGAVVDCDARPAFSLEKAFRVFGDLLFAALSGGHPLDKIEHMAEDAAATTLGWVKRSTAMRHRTWLSNHERRLQMRQRWAEFFEDVDVILLPVHPRPAIPHDQSAAQWERRVEIGGVEKDYLDLFPWVAPAGLAYLPATVVPVGMSEDGLPIGVQIVGPFLEDRTTLAFARALMDAVGECPRPAIAG